MASKSDIDDYNQELASKMSLQISIIKSYFEAISEVGEPLMSLDSINKFISQEEKLYHAIRNLKFLKKRLLLKNDASDKDSEISEYDHDTNFSNLNDDCIYQILSWLLLTNRVGVERVNKQWQRAVIRTLGSQEEIDLVGEHIFSKYGSSCCQSRNAINIENFNPKTRFTAFMSWLASVRSVHFFNSTFYASQLWLYYFEAWTQTKLRLESIKFVRCKLTTYLGETWQAFGDRYPFDSLTTAEFCHCLVDADFLDLVFQKASHSLKSLMLAHSYIEGRQNPIAFLPVSVERLQIEDHWRLLQTTDFNVSTTWLPFEAMKELVVSDDELLVKDDDLKLIERLIARMPSLETLTILLSSLTTINGNHLNGFRSLKSLALEMTSRAQLEDLQTLKPLTGLKRLFLNKFKATPEAFAKLCRRAPNLVSLCINYEVICQDCDQESIVYHANDDINLHAYSRRRQSAFDRWRQSRCPCIWGFLQPRAELAKLRRLDMNEANEQCLAHLVENELPDLRKLILYSRNSESLVQAFVNKAMSTPKLVFVLKWKGGLKEADIGHIAFPRNVRVRRGERIDASRVHLRRWNQEFSSSSRSSSSRSSSSDSSSSDSSSSVSSSSDSSSSDSS